MLSICLCGMAVWRRDLLFYASYNLCGLLDMPGIGKISGSHGGDYEGNCIVGCCAV
jgi:hypothetical protein